MNSIERRQEILKRLQTNGMVSIQSLADELLEKGLSVPDFLDGTTKQSLMEHARKVICVADSSKFNHAFLYRIAPLSNIDCIITDNGLDEQTLERFSAKNVTIITV